MHTSLLVVACLSFTLCLGGCTTFFKTSEENRSINAVSMTVDQTSNAREILLTIPSEAAMERFEMVDAEWRTISYVGFTETQIGALVFVDQKLHGVLSPNDAQAFYSCRGYSTALHRHWARDADAWSHSLLEQTKPVSEVELNFSGKSTVQSIREVVKSPLLEPFRRLVKLGSNPWSVFTTLDMLQDKMAAKENYELLTGITPGMGEAELAGVVRPEDVSFTSGGIVMAYPSHLLEYFVSEEIIRVIQQPSFYYLARTNIALFYAPNTRWEFCNPKDWMRAFPVQQGRGRLSSK